MTHTPTSFEWASAPHGQGRRAAPLGNGNCRWATGEEFRIIPEGKGDKEFLVETFMDVMDENDVEKAILLQGVLYGLQNEYAMECAEVPDRFKAAVMLDPFCRCAQRIIGTSSNDAHAHVFKFEVSVGGGAAPATTAISRSTAPEMTVLYRQDRPGRGRHSESSRHRSSPNQSSCQPEAVYRLAKKYPGLHIVVCHLLALFP